MVVQLKVGLFGGDGCVRVGVARVPCRSAVGHGAEVRKYFGQELYGSISTGKGGISGLAEL